MANRILEDLMICAWFNKAVNPCRTCGEKPKLKGIENDYQQPKNYALHCKCRLESPLNTDIDSHKCEVCWKFGNNLRAAWSNVVIRLQCLENRWNEMNPSESVWDKLTGVYTEAPAAAPFLEGLS